MFRWQKKQYTILNQQGIKKIKIIKDGPRFLIALGTLNNKKVLFKSTLPNHFDLKYNTIKIFKESIILKRLNNSNIHQLKKSCSKLINYSTHPRQAWYIKQFAQGQPQNIPGSNFIFKKDFFNTKNLNFLTNLLNNLSISTSNILIDKKLAKHLKTPKQYIDNLLKTFDWRAHKRYLDQVTIKKIIKLLKNNKKIIENCPKRLAHCEIYPSHIIKTKTNFKIIDWENLVLSNPATDAGVIWVRAYASPNWQQQFKTKFLENNQLIKHIEIIWDTEILLQTIGNIGYFNFTEKEVEIAHKGKILNFLINNVQQIIQKY